MWKGERKKEGEEEEGGGKGGRMGRGGWCRRVGVADYKVITPVCLIT